MKEKSNASNELLEMVRDADNIERICFLAIIHVIKPNIPPRAPDATRSELKKAVKRLRSAQHIRNCPTEMYEGFEAAILYIRREWLHR